MFKKINFFILVLTLQVAIMSQTTRYVKVGGTGNGSSWANASGDIQHIIDSSNNGDNIWIAKGTYLGPFSLKDKVHIYGGFIGGETNINARNFLINKTILSGDTNGDDIVSGSGLDLKFQNNNDNISPVVSSLNNTADTILDGFIITKGKSGRNSRSGPAGIFNYESSTTFNNCIIEYNYGSPNAQGGAICIDKDNYGVISKPLFTNCTIRNNTGYQGAGVYSRASSPTFLNCIFGGNLTMDLSFRGKGGAIYSYQKGELNIVNCLFAKNVSGIGGAIYSYETAVNIYNSIFFKNLKKDFQSIIETSTAGNDIEKEECGVGGIKIENSVLQNPKNEYKHYKAGCFVFGGTSYCTDSIDSEIITAPTDNNLYGLVPDFIVDSYVPKDCSPLINSGMSVSGITMPERDIVGNDRFIGSNIDIGPYENNASLLITNLFPQNNDTNVAVDSNLKITFEKEVTKNVGNIIIYDNINKVIEKISVDDVDISGKVVTINISKSLDKNKKYYFKIDKKAFKNGECNYFNGVTDKNTWTFTTISSKQSPVITFEDITKIYGDENFDLLANSDSLGTISYEIVPGGTGSASLSGVNNKSVSLGDVGSLRIKATVTATETHSQGSKEIILKIVKKDLTIKNVAINNKIYDGNTIASLSSNGILNGVLVGDNVSINTVKANFSDKNVGNNKFITLSTYTLAGTDSNNYSIIQPTGLKANISKKTLTIDGVQAEDKTYDGNTIAKLSGIVGLSGIVDLDDVSFTGTPLIGTFENNKIGSSKKVTVTGLSLVGSDKFNYILKDLELTATIKDVIIKEKEEQIITWNQDLILGCNGITSVILTAYSSSGLPVQYTSSNSDIGVITNAKLQLLKRGKITIEAFVPGNTTYKPAKIIIKEVLFKLEGFVKKDWDDTLSFNNISKEFVKYQWYKDGRLIPNMTKQYYTEDSLNGEYYLKVTDLKGDVYETCPVNFYNVTNKGDFKIYPNPVNRNSDFYIQTGFQKSDLVDSKISVFSISGNLIYTQNNVKQKNILKSPISPGVYIVLLEFVNGKVQSKNLLVK